MTAPAPDELLPCPFCGAKAMKRAHANSGYSIECGECYCGTGCRVSLAVAFEHWNTRAAQRPAAPRKRTLSRTENLVAFALHHLQADGALDRGELTKALRAAADDLATQPDRLAALEAVAKIADQLVIGAGLLSLLEDAGLTMAAKTLCDLRDALSRLNAAQVAKPNEPPRLDPRYQNGCYGDGR